MLVNEGVFKEVVVSHLPVGHTHEDIDQMFSRLAMYLRFNDAMSRQQLGECFQAAYTSKEGSPPYVEHWENVANLSEWFKTHEVIKLPEV